MKAAPAAINPGIIAILAVLIVVVTAATLGIGAQILCGLFTLVLLVLRANHSLVFSLYGVLIPVAPAFGSGCLLTITWLFLLCTRAGLPFRSLFYTFPLLAICGAWSLAELYWSGDLGTALLLWSQPAGIADLFNWLHESTPRSVTTLIAFFRIVTIFVLFEFFKANLPLCDRVRNGIIAALPIVLVCILIQFTSFGSIFPNYHAYWQELNRRPASFTDPNAFGVFWMLATVFFWLVISKLCHKSGLRVLALLVWLAVGMASGSRSYILGLGLVTIGLLYLTNRAVLLRTMILAGVCVVAVNLAALSSPDLYGKLLQMLPTTARRLTESVTLTTAAQAWFSRLVFIQIACAIWWDQPLLGAGFQHFKSLVPEYVEKLGLNIGLWSDNANNFYLGLLAEMGLVGLTTLLLLLVCLRWKNIPVSNEARLLRLSLLALMLLLFVGPHLDFDEVTVITALIMAYTLEVRFVLTPRLCSAIAIILFFAVAVKSSSGEYGFYAWERGPEGKFRWTGRYARGIASCDEKGVATLVVRAPLTDIALKPMHLLVGNREATQNFILNSTEKLKVPLVCKSASGKVETFELKVSRVWVPRRQGSVTDPRPLGVQVFHDLPEAIAPKGH